MIKFVIMIMIIIIMTMTAAGLLALSKHPHLRSSRALAYEMAGGGILLLNSMAIIVLLFAMLS